ncbi:DUF3987 domain-containing protein [Acidithiobacillus sp. AMEEHan]|uniref:DUF3987 domain-containing protein n=1 Tax=Acidithiobacillus sp. AMEEHan TaxID=2994951 RepID=UPI0027E46074|nr:DUF3987 domain-containing protein [Acidithiobacillus sp. AMEEHan]
MGIQNNFITVPNLSLLSNVPPHQRYQTPPAVSPEGLVSGELFPYRAVPPSLRRIAAAFQAKTQGPGTMIFFSMLTAWATAMAPQYDLEGINGRPLPISLFSIFESPSGTGKTAVGQEIFRPIINYNREVMLLMAQDHDTGIRKRPKQMFARLIFSDPTIPGLRKMLAKAYPVGVLLNFDAELVLNKTLFRNDRDFCSIYSGEDIVVARANYEVAIVDPRLSLCFMTQSGTVSNKLRNDREFRSSGLIARMFLIMPRSVVGEKHILREPDTTDDQFIELWNKRLTEALVHAFGKGRDYPKNRRIIPLSPDAKFYTKEMSKRIDAQINQDYFIKWPEEALRVVEKVLRVACLLALWERPGETVVEIEDIKRSEEIYWGYFESLLDLMERSDHDPDLLLDSEDLLRFIDRTLQQGAGSSWFDGKIHHWYVRKSIIQQFGPSRLRAKAKLERVLSFLELGRSVAVCKGFVLTADGRNVKATLVERLLNSQQFDF